MFALAFYFHTSLAFAMRKVNCSASLWTAAKAIGIDSSHLLAILKTDMSPSKGKKPVQESPLFAICESTTLAIHNLAALVNIAELSLSDSLVIQAVYTSIGPIFAGDPQEEGKRSAKSAAVQSATGQPSIKGLKLESLALLRSVSAPSSPTLAPHTHSL
jgi:hypothetical protein